MKGFLLLLACLLGSCQAQLFSDCPADALSHPCQCDGQSINCSDAKSAEQIISSLTTGFHDIAEFRELLIVGSSITYLPADVFRPIRAHTITIMQNANLSYIDEDAFAGSEDFIRYLSLFANDLKGVDIFLAVAKMKGIEYASLVKIGLTSVPERALATMPELAWVNLSSNRISSLGREAFADCPKLKGVLIYDNLLRVLPGRILASEGVPASIGESLVFYAYENQIEEIAPDAFDGIEKRLDFILRGNRLRTLPREIFQPLLDRHLEEWETSSIVLTGNPFICDCRMRWLVENPKYFKILWGMKCSGTNKLLELYSLSELGQCLS